MVIISPTALASISKATMPSPMDRMAAEHNDSQLVESLRSSVQSLSTTIGEAPNAFDAVTDWDNTFAAYDGAIALHGHLERMCTAVSLLAASNPRGLAVEIAALRKHVRDNRDSLRKEQSDLVLEITGETLAAHDSRD